MCATYIPFLQLPSGRLPSLFRKLLCTQRTYHALLTIVELAQAHPSQGYFAYMLIKIVL